MKSAVAIGGMAAFSACLGREQVDIPTGPDDLSSLPERQHAWNDVLPTDDHGNVLAPQHRVLLFVNYDRDGTPTSSDRKTFETALQGVEHAYEHSGQGLLLTTSYSPSYFERFDANLPESVDLPAPEALAPFEDPKLDTPDTVVHLASNHAQAVLGAEEALKGNKSKLNGVDQPDAALTDVFEIADRRTGFVGKGLPADNASDADGVPADKVPEDSPLFMGFKSGFQKNQASEDRITIQSGPFAEGSTQHISHLKLNLDQWYNQDDHWQREAKMFCPHHAENNVVEGAGDNLGTTSKMDECSPTEKAAREQGVVGHSQKMTRARTDNSPVILRRDFNSTDGGHAGLHFVALQRGIGDFVDTRNAMNGSDVAKQSAVGQRNNNGILQYIQTTRRGNYLVPPRSLRALPPAKPSSRTEDVHATT
ncbi:MAG: Tat pathway signal protein [Halorientalis sp.]